MNHRAIVVFAKAPVPGKVKTRLLTVLSPSQAAALHARLTLETIRLATRGNLAKVYLYGHPDTGHPFFQALAKRFGVTLRTQWGKDLGERMSHALTETLTRHRQVLLLGCDCPSLEFRDLEMACQALAQGHQVVLGPAEDGGYVLIGTSTPLPYLFRDIPWGSDRVLEETLVRIRKHHLDPFLLPMQWDLDRPGDLKRYRHLRQQAATGQFIVNSSVAGNQ